MSYGSPLDLAVATVKLKPMYDRLHNQLRASIREEYGSRVDAIITVTYDY